MDYLIRQSAANGTIRAFAITARDTVDEARIKHNTTPVVTAAIGRVIMAASMMSAMEKSDDALLTIQISGDGPVRGITATASPRGVLKIYPEENSVIIPPKYKGKLDVGGAIGTGILRVLREESKGAEPYIGTVNLVSGEIAEDITYYFAQSEQIPSSVGLGVLVDKDHSVAHSGGFIVQLMPDASEESIYTLENNIKKLLPVTQLLSDGMTPEDILDSVLSGLSNSTIEKKPVSYCCDCSADRFLHALATLPEKDISDIINDAKPIEVRCHFCNKKYTFSTDDLRNILETRRR